MQNEYQKWKKEEDHSKVENSITSKSNEPNNNSSAVESTKEVHKYSNSHYGD